MPWPGMAEKRPCCHAVGAARQMLHFPLLIPEARSYVVQRIFKLYREGAGKQLFFPTAAVGRRVG